MVNTSLCVLCFYAVLKKMSELKIYRKTNTHHLLRFHKTPMAFLLMKGLRRKDDAMNISTPLNTEAGITII